MVNTPCRTACISDVNSRRVAANSVDQKEKRIKIKIRITIRIKSNEQLS